MPDGPPGKNSLLVRTLVFKNENQGSKRREDAILPHWFVTVGAGLLYGLHPALVEGMAFFSGRFDLLLAHDDPERALRAFGGAGALGTHPADVAAGQSAALIEPKAWPQAEAMLQEALQQTPDDARLDNNLGVIAREEGDLDAAQAYFARAAELAPD